MEKLKEYKDRGDNYTKPERYYENEVHDIRVYCEHKGCKTYIKGKEGYNGGFVAETGQMMDMRNQVFICEFHHHLYKHEEPKKVLACDLNIEDFKNCEIWKAQRQGCTHCIHYKEIKQKSSCDDCHQKSSEYCAQSCKEE